MINVYIRNRMKLEALAKDEQCEGGELDESGSGALWDWAGYIASHDANEMQDQIYYALQEIFEHFNSK